MISDKPKWCAKIMNGNKTTEVRKNKALASAIQKLINENGYADIYVYCSKDNNNLLHKNCADIYWVEDRDFRNKSKRLGIESQPSLNGKVLFKFRCYKVEEIKQRIGVFWVWGGHPYYTDNVGEEDFLNRSCLSATELENYLKGNGYAIHISDLEIFDKPRELSEFYKFDYLEEKIKFGKEIEDMKDIGVVPDKYYVEVNYRFIDKSFRLTKAPQNFCYVEVEK